MRFFASVGLGLYICGRRTVSNAGELMDASLRNRLTFGPLMLLGLVLLLWLDHVIQAASGVRGVGVLALMLVIVPMATMELATLFSAVHVQPYRMIALTGSSLLAIHAFATQFRWFEPVAASTLAFIIVFVMILAALRRAMMRQSEEAIHHMAGTVLATLYLGGLGWFLMALRVKQSVHVRGTTMVILMILLVVKSTDIGAFFGGKTFGRHKLIPWLSPGKTWEGLICGVMTAGGVGAACAAAIDYRLEWWKGLIFGVVIGAIGQAGDLLESLMKRDAAVKDSGQLVPGFGGILDIIDSPLLAAPFAYLLFSLF